MDEPEIEYDVVVDMPPENTVPVVLVTQAKYQRILDQFNAFQTIVRVHTRPEFPDRAVVQIGDETFIPIYNQKDSEGQFICPINDIPGRTDNDGFWYLGYLKEELAWGYIKRELEDSPF